MFSVVLATHNEAHNLAKCFAPLKGLADEVIVVDGESTDDTVRIATQFGARVISTTNKANFHINKQLAMDAAEGELVLQLDADEVVDDEFVAFIRRTHEAMMSGEKLPAAWWIQRKNFFLGKFLKKGGQYPDPVIRLYQKGKAKLPQKDVHEQMLVEGEVATAAGHLLHYSNPTFSEYLRKFNTYTSFTAHKLYEQKKKISLVNIFTYLFLKPFFTFVSLFLRHRGYVDGVAGFTFAVFSGLHNAIAFLKLWELYERE